LEDASCDRYDRVYYRCINDRGSHHLHDGFSLRAERIRLAAKLGLNKALTEALTGQISASIGSCEDFAPKNQRFDRLTNLIIKHWEFKHQIEDLRTKTGVSAKNHSFSLRIKSSDSSIQNQDFAGYNGWVEGFWRLVRIVDWYMGTCRTNTNQ
jgi:hypothetical protein